MKVFVVLGAHRSATSLVAKGLHESGVHMGDDLLGATSSNRCGHYEDLSVIRLNDRILAAAGGAWDAPPSAAGVEAVADRFADDAVGYIDGRSVRELWGWKDPRTVLTWPVWRSHLTGDVHLIHVVRGARQVAESLSRRDGMDLDAGLRLARVYQKRAHTIMGCER